MILYCPFIRCTVLSLIQQITKILYFTEIFAAAQNYYWQYTLFIHFSLSGFEAQEALSALNTRGGSNGTIPISLLALSLSP